jgi:hypothetical protein
VMTVMTKQSRPAYCTRTVRVHVVCLFSKVVCTFTRTCVHVHIIILLSKVFSTVRKYENIYL